MVRSAPVKASRFITLPTDMQEMLIYNGAVPVNDVFFPFWLERKKIQLYYGGYGSGKSVFIIDKLIDKCLNNKIFKCFYGRKVFEWVRETVFATICDRIEERGLQDHFAYSRLPKSSMYIRCLDNENVFIPFGCDKPDKLKSVKDPTDIFCEEFDQFDQKDFEILYPRLRKIGVDLCFIGAFNTTTVHPKHWLKDFFFPDEQILPEDKRWQFHQNLAKCFCNYTDNYFIDQKDYEGTLWIAAAFREKKFMQLSRGDWGSMETDNLWAYSFKREKHIVDVTTPAGKELMTLDKRLPVYLVFDFNVDPMTCLVCQKNGMQWAKILAEYRERNSDIFEICERIKTDLLANGYFVVATGDASGRNRDANSKAKASFVDNIKAELRLSDKQLQFPKANPSIPNTRMVLNAVLHKHPAIYISSACQFLIDDLETVQADGLGGILDQKKLEKDLKGHLFANARYFFWNYFRQYINFKSLRPKQTNTTEELKARVRALTNPTHSQ